MKDKKIADQADQLRDQDRLKQQLKGEIDALKKKIEKMENEREIAEG